MEVYGVKINKDQITTLISAVNEETEKWNKPILKWKIIQAQLTELFGEKYTKYLEI